MDSAQVYRGMDVGTAKPDAAERARVPHHLIDLVDPDQSFSTGRWLREAIAAVVAIVQRDHVPLIVGGTMLYYRALAGGLDELPQANARLRAAIDARAAREGWPALHAELAQVDAAAARRISANDPQRIQRALEVWEITRKPISAQQSGARRDLPFEMRAFALVPERAELHRRIEARFDAMLAAGLVDEVRMLRTQFKLDKDMSSMRAVGYRQVWQHLEGEIDAAEMRARSLAATRQLAKRQLTWLRRFPELQPAEQLVQSFL